MGAAREMVGVPREMAAVPRAISRRQSPSLAVGAITNTALALQRRHLISIPRAPPANDTVTGTDTLASKHPQRQRQSWVLFM